MHSSKRQTSIFLVSILLGLCIFISSAFAQIDIKRPDIAPSDTHFMNFNTIYFEESTKDRNELTAKLFCIDDQKRYDFNSEKWENDTLLFYFDLSQIKCKKATIELSHIKNNEIMTEFKDINIQKYVSNLPLILNQQKTDGSFGSIINTGYALWALSLNEEIYKNEIDIALDYLKKNRHNTEKCWPTDSCNIKTTVQTLGLLNLAGFDEELRIISDSKLWMQEKQNTPKESTWTIQINNTKNSSTTCAYSYMTTSKNETLSVSESVNYTLTPTTNEYIRLACTQDVKITITDKSKEVFQTTDDSVQFHIEIGCWDDVKKWNECNIETTSYGLISKLDDTHITAAKTWLETKFDDGFAYTKYLGDQDIIATSLFLYQYPDDEDVRDWLLFRQNNDGSWGTSTDTEDNIISTAFALFSLEKAGVTLKNENIKDGTLWLANTEPDSGWGSVMNNALTFIATHESVSNSVTTTPKYIIFNQDEITLEVINPTPEIYSDITVEASNSLKPYLALSKADPLESNSHIYIDIKKNGTIDEDKKYYGYINIKNEDKLIGFVPLVIKKTSTMSLAPKSNDITTYNTQATIVIPIEKITDSFTCTITNPSTKFSIPETISLTKNDKNVILQATLTQKVRQDIKETLTFDCSSSETTIKNPVNVIITQYEDIPFIIEPEIISSTNVKDVPKLVIKNNLNEKLTVTYEVVELDYYFSNTKQTLILQPNEEQKREIFNIINLPNVSAILKYDTTITVNAGSYEQKIPFSMEAVHKQRNFIGSFFAFVWGFIKFIVYLFLLFVVIILLLRLYFTKVKKIMDQKKGPSRILNLNPTTSGTAQPQQTAKPNPSAQPASVVQPQQTQPAATETKKEEQSATQPAPAVQPQQAQPTATTETKKEEQPSTQPAPATQPQPAATETKKEEQPTAQPAPATQPQPAATETKKEEQPTTQPAPAETQPAQESAPESEGGDDEASKRKKKAADIIARLKAKGKIQ